VTTVTVASKWIAYSCDHGEGMVPHSTSTGETVMDKQQLEISEMELTTEELNDVSGGRTNADSDLYRAFMHGVIDGYNNGGGNVVIIFR
jgi:hypothetical protein